METGRNPSAEPDLPDLMTRVARGDQDAFASLYDVVAGPVLGIVRKVLRDGLIRLRDCLGARRDPGGSATLTGAYALHALADDERECFERHAADCADCTREVRELSATAARLGLAVTASPGPALKDQVMRRITTVRQEPPRALPHGSPGPRHPPAPARAMGSGRGGLARRYGGVAARARPGHPGAGPAGRTACGAGDRGPHRPRRQVTYGEAGGWGERHGGRVPEPGPGGVHLLEDGEAAGRQGVPAVVRRRGTMRSAGLMDPGRTAEAVLLEGSSTVRPAWGSPWSRQVVPRGRRPRRWPCWAFPSECSSPRFGEGTNTRGVGAGQRRGLGGSGKKPLVRAAYSAKPGRRAMWRSSIGFPLPLIRR